jgi:hypothetical protein
MSRVIVASALLLLSAAAFGCGAAPAASVAPGVREAAPAAAAGKARPGFRFYSYAGLSVGERRVLAASRLALDPESPTLSGEALYDHLAARAPKVLANYLNQTAVMATIRLADGRTALDCVTRVEDLKINHVYAVVDPALKPAIAAIAVPKSRPDAPYVGPEDSSLMHGKYDTSYRENRPYTSQQFAFSAADGFTKVDIDLDEECPLAGSKLALAQHLMRAIKHEILRKVPGTQYGENSEPDYFYRALTLAPTEADGKPNKVGRGLQPNYRLETP